MHERGADCAPNVSSPEDAGKGRRATGCQCGPAHDGHDAAACPASTQCSVHADRTSPNDHEIGTSQASVAARPGRMGRRAGEGIKGMHAEPPGGSS